MASLVDSMPRRTRVAAIIVKIKRPSDIQNINDLLHLRKTLAKSEGIKPVELLATPATFFLTSGSPTQISRANLKENKVYVARQI